MNELIKVMRYAGNEIRTSLDEDGIPWFCLKDICDLLSIKTTANITPDLDDNEYKTLSITRGTPGNPNMTFISESGLYAAIARSRKPEAKDFKRWVRKDVLPAIRKTGGYLTDEAKANPRRLLQSMTPAERLTMVAESFQVDLDEANARVDVEHGKRVDAERAEQLLIADNTRKNDAVALLARESDEMRNDFLALARHAWKVVKTYKIDTGEDLQEKARGDLFSKSAATNITKFPGAGE
tara:strand:+ start:421 stop:1137 length:717 start_codon:yes stop_codon:yes gene_type:complete